MTELGCSQRVHGDNFLLHPSAPFHYCPFGKTNGLYMHKGNIKPGEAFARLESNPNAVLVDCRTQPEWAFVGVPAVERLIQLSWQQFPSMQVNADFIPEIEKTGLPKDTEFLFICRSGARSSSAAAALTAAGYSNCWNVAEGFEGDRDATGHRGTVGGWKAAGLPWVQS